MRKLILTFDTEDFISDNSVWVLHKILESLKKHDLKAIFFITGHMAERLRNFDHVVELLNDHLIGYHSSGHSVHPTIYEFTDVENYKQAYDLSLQRETSHINPLTGEMEGKGGILALRELFHEQPINLFRAPGHCWVPPHLEALRTLGVCYDFSAALSLDPVTYKGLTFYPYHITGHWQGTITDYRILLFSLLKRKLAILTIHPSLLVNKNEWDSIYSVSNPKEISSPIKRSASEIRQLLRNFNLLLDHFVRLQKLQLAKIESHIEKTDTKLSIDAATLNACYQKSMRWAFKQGYRPRFLFRHFCRFFEITA